MELKCGGCGTVFTASRANAKWCSPRCRQRGRRGASTAEVTVDRPETPADGGGESRLVVEVRRELDRGGCLDTFAGQLAIQLARNVSAADAKGVASLSKELRTVMAAALGSAPVPPPVEGESEAEPEDDEVTRARKARERKASAAAGRA